MKPKLSKKTNLYGNVYWVCKSKHHEAYGDTPSEAYQFWEALKGLYKKGAVAQFEFDIQHWKPYSALKYIPTTYSSSTKM